MKLIFTLIFLKPKQVIYYVIKRYLPQRILPVKNSICDVSYIILTTPVVVYGLYKSNYIFNFLNIKCGIKNGKIDWSPIKMSRLWQYNLHYFDYLRENERVGFNKEELIDSWIELNPVSSKPGWEPYTTSLRIVNWVFYFSKKSEEELCQPWCKNLFNQILWLEKNLELHILANHYFENIKALLFGGFYFKGEDSQRWRDLATEELNIQLQEQFLLDGGHYERTPQYHCRMLENCLDIYNLLKHNSESKEKVLLALTGKTIENGLMHLNSILFPDNTIPLFNDSALASADYPNKIIEYSKRLGFELPEQTNLIAEQATGLYGYRTQQDMFIIDCGDIGPSYQPGHTHCDFLSYELMVNRKKLIVDSGVYEYEKGEMRDYVRSTKVHNTISVDHDEQSEIWGEFRVARRAKKLSADIVKNNNQIQFNGSYKGFFQLGGKVVHSREATLDMDEADEYIQSIIIQDEISGISGEHLIRSYIHLHPDFVLQDKGMGEIAVNDDNKHFATIHIDNGEYALEKSWYCPEFGLKYENPCVEITVIGRMPIKSGYWIEIH